MLGQRNGDLPDAGGCLYPFVWILRCQARRPEILDWLEPERVAQAVKAMKLKHAVITSVNRDERRDGGAPIFAQVIRRIRQIHPGCSVEVLIPDFKASSRRYRS